MSLLQIGTSGLLASQKSLSVVSNNIANAETEGYSRQLVQYTPNYTFYPTLGALGTGVTANSVNRIASSFLTAELWDSQSRYNNNEVRAQYLNELDQRLGNESLSLATGFDNFFTALNGSSIDPFSSSARRVVLTESEALAERFNTQFNYVDSQAIMIGRQLEATTAQANSLLENIAEFNKELIALSTSDQPANELLDKRDLAIRQLSELVTVNAMEQKDGTINIYMKTGQALVSSSRYNTLNVAGVVTDTDGFNVMLNTESLETQLNSSIGGILGGLLGYQANELVQARNELGRLALVFSDQVNQQLLAGEDLNGNNGIALFSDLNTLAGAYTPLDSVSSAVSTLRIADTNQLMASDYDLRVDNSGNYSITRRRDNAIISSGLLSGGSVDTLAFDGVEIDIDGAATDQFYRLSPLRYAARDFGVVMSDPEELAYAQPGGGTGDNRNLLELIGLQQKKVMNNSQTTLGQGYASFVSDIAVLTSKVKTELEGNTKLLNQAETARSSFSGVNLDEEAASLLRFQQLYSANAQVISVARTTFDSLLGIF
ncbi:MAG: flagellar hook-associated protein FlgK [Endozoicomonas sp. (ex Botrylloides leachii)]|nr:flagellar hook-associated protein FlgK [Endozoicomonas sp. (ex Botrylloides leachii)]